MKHSKLFHILTLALGLLLVVSSANAGGFIKFEGIDGDAKTKRHRSWSQITGFSQSISTGDDSGSARKRSSARFDALVVTRQLDKASPKLADAIAKGKEFGKVTLELTTEGREEPAVYYIIELSNVRIVSYQVAGGAEGLPSEELRLVFDEVKITYLNQDDKGKGKEKVEFSWKVDQAK